VAVTAPLSRHGRAGDIAARRMGEEALIASDVIAALPAAFASLHARRRGDRVSVLG
jgi:NAD(P)H-hydrate repair Nnr-like enzyme with NAD(P)H-hydrate dehydratase domain